ncbi:MAG: c-type cytochrome [Bacteroidales bacterium]|nr:c-type cytochrome [Bacteroidales bacterium]
MKIFKTISFFVLIAILMAACNRDKNHPGYIYFPDMHYSQAYETYDVNPVFETGMTNRLPAEGTVPRGYQPYPFSEKTVQNQTNAGLMLINPIEVNEEVLAKGKEQFDIFCKVCHGPQGKGDGVIYTKKLFPVQPTSLVDDYVQNKPDGEIFHVITMGSLSGLMGAHGSMIPPENRWKIIHYVRTLAQ